MGIFFVVKATTFLTAYFFPPLAAEAELRLANPILTATTGRPFQIRTMIRSTKLGLSSSLKTSEAVAISSVTAGIVFAPSNDSLI